MHRYREALEINNIRLTKVLQKMRYVNDIVAVNDPLLWSRLADLTDKSFQRYVKDQSARIMGVIGDDNTIPEIFDFYTRGASLLVSGKSIPGINLNEFSRNLAEGKRPLVFWVENDKDKAQKMSRRIKKQLQQK
ncbi:MULTISPECIES: hypothetical protein [unclassified Oceanispirochaeta]|uniref:hypothetical protein n=1 Tax=unclassified Oceanispirochaeta TaxID=2635722 RepID=UPI000E09036D|nr:MULTISPECIES: hypothetical protein [unclassified Oceanispirochaeta]MBF9018302.1 hypothetical protein [Oceanispirochaeta sp. M2]NPD74767.1 hypothetical protein [Oceanispirochaeta sp. M1]RDG29380.1 hypothetical protein DV872_21940 [Oceanispirochaeta sp. M1]